jgi:deazaflavin-dependent oxidoreductase (nitroreductase family)
VVDVDGKIPNTTVSVETALNLMLEHVQLYLEDGSRAHLWDSAPVGGPGPVPTLLLLTTGARSGNQRYAPLVYGTVDGAYVIVASGGNERHPSWYYNLVAQPEVRIKVAADEKRVRARTAEGDERRRLWDHMTRIYPPYEGYQQNTGRTIPVVVLEEC